MNHKTARTKVSEIVELTENEADSVSGGMIMNGQEMSYNVELAGMNINPGSGITYSWDNARFRN